MAKNNPYALDFSVDDNAYIDIPDDIISNHDLTVEFWCYIKDFGSSYPRIISIANNDIKLQIGLNADDKKLYCKVNDNDSVETDESLELDTYYFVSIIITTDEEITIYINGEIKEYSDGGPTGDPNESTIGKGLDFTQDQDFKGILDEVRFWDKLLTEEQIKKYMNKKFEGDEEGLVVYYKFDEGEGDTAYDSAGDNDGTIVDAEWVEGEIDLFKYIYLLFNDNDNCKTYDSDNLEWVTITSYPPSEDDFLNDGIEYIELDSVTQKITEDSKNFTHEGSLGSGNEFSVSIPDLLKTVKSVNFE